MSNLLMDAFRAAIPRMDAPLLHTDRGETITYGEMLTESGRYARLLVELGVAPGDRVVVQVDKSPAALMLYLGCIRAGAIFLPLNTSYTPAEVEYFVGDAEPRAIFASPSSREAIGRIAAAHGAVLATLDADGKLDRSLPADGAFADVARAADDVAAILYTSGTTGRSKGAMLTQNNLLSNALTCRDYWAFTGEDRLIHALPIFHTHGLFVACHVVMLAGARMDFLPKFDADQIIALMPSASVLMGVPTFYTRLLRHPRMNRELASGMRLFISGSAPLLPETHDEFSERTGHRILERYGMTETGMNTSNPYDGERIAGTVGFALPGIEVRIVDADTAEPVAPGAPGMIEVRGPNVFSGYWRMPEKTAAEFRPDGFFITGDIGTMDAEGRIVIVGRAKDLIISGGFNIYPQEIEEAINSMDGVAESAVVGAPDADFGECVVAYVVRRDPAVDEASIRGFLADRLARFKQPRIVLFIDDLPRNTMGKVQKVELRTSAAQAAAAQAPVRPASSGAR